MANQRITNYQSSIFLLLFLFFFLILVHLLLVVLKFLFWAFDCRHCPSTLAVSALESPQSHLIVFDKLCVLSFADLTLDVFLRVLNKEILDLFGLDDNFDHETLVTDRSLAAELGDEEVHDVFGVSVQLFADVNKVDNCGLFRTDSGWLGWLKHNLWFFSKLRIIFVQQIDGPLEQLCVPFVVVDGFGLLLGFFNFRSRFWIRDRGTSLGFLFILLGFLGFFEIKDLNFLKFLCHCFCQQSYEKII